MNRAVFYMATHYLNVFITQMSDVTLLHICNKLFYLSNISRWSNLLHFIINLPKSFFVKLGTLILFSM